MTCVSCSSAIERAMKTEFTKKGLVEAQIGLLTHKMRLVFEGSEDDQVDPKDIIDEVEAIGFGVKSLLKQ